MIINNGQGSYNTTVTGALDGDPCNFESFTLGEAGIYPVGAENTPTVAKGLTSGTYTSLTSSGAQFAFQSFTANNALLLNSGLSATLTLTNPSAVSTLTIFGTTAGGSSSSSVLLTFSDASTSLYTLADNTGIGRDWFQPDASTALAIGGRLSNRGEDAYTNLFYEENASISLFESLLTLSAADQAKTLSSLTFTHTSGGTLAVMGVSGEVIPVPEASASAMLLLAGLTGLRRRRR
ncbi:MAG: hypothetical protein EOP86_14115 [Verrucomicrobiaceae bacterium]|nr:MAG: hypothetical protein EOP86_14115 [Verrucomicrobiaceae bacterium]